VNTSPGLTVYQAVIVDLEVDEEMLAFRPHVAGDVDEHLVLPAVARHLARKDGSTHALSELVVGLTGE
jgi:hypothetical protein